MLFEWGGNLSLVTLTFDLDIQTRLSEGPHVFRVNLVQIRSAIPELFDSQATKQKKLQKCSSLRAVTRQHV